MTKWTIGVNGKPRRVAIANDPRNVPLWRRDGLFATEREAWRAAHKQATRAHGAVRRAQRQAARDLTRIEARLVECERAIERLPHEAAKGAVRG